MLDWVLVGIGMVEGVDEDGGSISGVDAEGL